MNINMKSTLLMRLTVTSAAVLLAACSTLPAYQAPQVEVQNQWSEGQTQAQKQDEGLWKTARPADHEARGAWWRAFDDEQLNALQETAANANQELKRARRACCRPVP